MFGLAGQTNLEKAQVDEIVDAVNDLFNARVAAVRETDEVKKTELTKTLMSETIPNTLVRNFLDFHYGFKCCFMTFSGEVRGSSGAAWRTVFCWKQSDLGRPPFVCWY